MEKKLIEFIKEEFSDDSDEEITIDTKLISSGLIDSFSLVSLQKFILKEFGKRIPSPKITAESFDTIKQIVEIIKTSMITNKFLLIEDALSSLSGELKKEFPAIDFLDFKITKLAILPDCKVSVSNSYNFNS